MNVGDAEMDRMDRRQREEEEDDLDEDRRVADDLDVDAAELAQHGDAVGADRAEHEPDRRREDDPDHRDLHRPPEPLGEGTAVVPDHGPVEAGEEGHVK